MQNIAYDDHASPGDIAVLFLYGEGIQKGLAGVCVCAVAGVDDGSLAVAGDDGGDAAVLVAHDDVVHLHAHERVYGIVYALSFYNGGGGYGEGGYISRETVGRYLE